MRKNRILCIVLSCLFVVVACCAPFVAVVATERSISPRYAQTYYGELAKMYDKLANTDGKKIVVIGNSNVPFGLDSALAESLLKQAGLDYSVCNFGLYGALGTRFMCELAEKQIKSGDIVVVSTELYPQTMSTYFSAEEAWYALDSNTSLFWQFPHETRKILAAGYVHYSAQKHELYKNGQCAEGSDVYAVTSFDDNCDLKNFPTDYNTMQNGTDVNNPIVFDNALFSEDFCDFINGFADRIVKRGASIYYSFAPMNNAAVSEEEMAKKDEFFAYVSKKLRFTVISDINDYLLDKEWFYDSNFHLNTSGRVLRTVQLVCDIKNQLGDNSKTECVLPDKPIAPDGDIVGEGDNSCADMFTYVKEGNYCIVTGLTDVGKLAEKIVVPYSVDGLVVKSFNEDVFSNNKNLRSVTLQKNISRLPDRAFYNCDNLQEIVLLHSAPSEISVGYRLLDGTPNDCNIFVEKAALSKFKNNYFWGRYAKRLASIDN